MGRGKPPAPPLAMTARQRRLLEHECGKRTTLRQFYERIPIILRGAEGQSNGQIARELNLALNTVKSWRNRWQSNYQALLDYETGPEGGGVSDHDLLQKMLECFKDQPRSGAPLRITLAQKQQIIALACEKPTDYGVEMTDWTLEMLAKVAIAQNIVDSISSRYVGEILKNEQVATAQERVLAVSENQGLAGVRGAAHLDLQPDSGGHSRTSSQAARHQRG
jgi:transposase